MLITRRSLGKVAAAALVVIATPSLAVSTTDYGWTEDGEFYRGVGFGSRDDAIKDARGYLDIGAKIQTAEIDWATMCYPNDCAENVVDWSLNGGSIGDAMAEWLTSANETGDYDGDFADACFLVDRAALGDAGRVAVGQAMRRLDAHDLAGIVETSAILPNDVAIPESLWTPLTEDKVLSAQLLTAIRTWAETHDLASELHGLTANNVRDHIT